MKKIAFILLSLLSLANDARAQFGTPVEFEVMIEQKSAQGATNKWEYMWRPWTNSCPCTLHLFRTMVYDDVRHVEYNGSGSLDYVAHSKVKYTNYLDYDVQEFTGEQTGTWESEVVNHHPDPVYLPADPFYQPECWDPPLDTVQHDHWTYRIDPEDYYFDPSDDPWNTVQTNSLGQVTATYTHTNFISATSAENHYITKVYDPDGSDPSAPVEIYDRYQKAVISDEFTTDDMISKVIADYPNDWEVGGTPEGFLHLNSQETSVTLKKSQFRFKVKAEAFQLFHIDYEIHYLGDDGAKSVTPAGFQGFGTGDWAYYTPPDDELVIRGAGWRKQTCIDCPEQSCNLICSNQVGGRVWIELGCSGMGSTCGGSCTRPNGPGTVNVRMAGFGPSVLASLGSDTYGKFAGNLDIGKTMPGADFATPASVEYVGNLKNVDLVKASGNLRQAKADSTLADIVTVSGTKYQVKFYHSADVGSKDGSGIYAVSGTPYNTITVEQISNTNHIRVTVDSGTPVVYDYNWSDTAHGWTLSSAGLRKDYTAWSASSLIRTNAILDMSDNIVHQEVQYFQTIGSLGNVITKKVAGTGTALLTNQWYYYDNTGTDGTNFGKVRLTIEPSGSWTRYEYDTNGRISKVVSQFQNAATNAADNLCRVTEYDYSATDTNAFESERQIEKLLGQEISRQYVLHYPTELRTIRCQTSGATWTNADNLVTVTTFQTDDDFFGRVKSVLNPNGTMELYTYAAYGSYKVETVYSGQPNVDGTSIVDGTRTVTTSDADGTLLERATYYIKEGEFDVLTRDDEYVYYENDLKRDYTVYRLDGYESAYYNCCALDRTEDRDGTTTTYEYDGLKRLIASTRNSVTMSNALDAAGNSVASVRFGSDNSPIVQRGAVYDTASRLTRETNALGGVTTYAYSVGNIVRTITNPDGGTRIETYYQDGSLSNVTGTAAFPEKYEYGVESEGGVQRAYTKSIKLDSSGGTAEWTKSYTDFAGRSYKTLYAAASGTPASTSYFNSLGQRWKTVDPDGVTTLYAYNGKVNRSIRPST